MKRAFLILWMLLPLSACEAEPAGVVCLGLLCGI